MTARSKTGAADPTTTENLSWKGTGAVWHQGQPGSGHGASYRLRSMTAAMSSASDAMQVQMQPAALRPTVVTASAAHSQS